MPRRPGVLLAPNGARPPGCMEVFMPYEHDIRDIRDDVRDGGITLGWAITLAMFAAAAAMIWFAFAAVT